MENKPSHIALVVLGSILVLLVFFIGALAMLDRFTDQPAQSVPVVSEQGLTPAAELAFQEQDALMEKQAGMSSKDTVVANINLSDATILSQDEGVIRVGVNIVNQGDTPQGDIRYGIELMKTISEGSVKVETFIVDETLTIAGSDSLTREILYQAPMFLSGDYELWVTAKTTGGLMLGLANVGSITLAGSGDYVEIIPESCFVSAKGDTTHNILDQGIDVSKDDEISLSCVVHNHTTETVTFIPTLETRNQSSYGSVVDMTYPITPAISLTPGEKKELEFTITKLEKPQAYNVTLTLTDVLLHTPLSNKISTHYILQGESATIQNISLDKTTYASGETITAALFWTASGDPLTGVATIGVTDTDGTRCATLTKEITSAESITSLIGIAERDCVAPRASIILTDKSGDTLDSRSIESPTESTPVFSTTTTPAPVTGAWLCGGISTTMIVVIVITLIIILTVLIVRRRMMGGETVPPTNVFKSFLLLALLTPGMFFGAEEAEAVTWVSPTAGTYIYTVNANRTSYSPGEPIVITSSVSIVNNPTQQYANILTGDIQKGSGHTLQYFSGFVELLNASIYGGQSTFNVTTIPAPSTIDSYDIYIQAISPGQHTNTNASVSIAVTAASLTDCGTVTDADGNTYDTVVIGSQCWMKENMRVGSMIPISTGQTNNSVIQKYCYGDNLANCMTVNHPNYPDGGLYNWDEAMQYASGEGVQGICPGGWHIPTDAEWYTLENYLKDVGQTCNASRTGYDCSTGGTKLKSGGASGFEGNLSGTGSMGSGSFSNRNTYGVFWSSDAALPFAFHATRQLEATHVTVYRQPVIGSIAHSVRCVQGAGAATPDLSAANIAPVTGTSFTTTQNITFIGTVVNSPAAVVTEGGWAGLEIDRDSNGSIDNYYAIPDSSTQLGSFALGETKNLTMILSAGTLPVGNHRYRFNVDSTNLLTETDDVNNQPPWVQFIVTVASASSADLTPAGCLDGIPYNASTCSASIDWTFYGVPAPAVYEVKKSNSAGVSTIGTTITSGGWQTFPNLYTYGLNTITAIGNGTTLNTQSRNIGCKVGSVWYGATGTCYPAPDIDITATPALIRYDSQTDVAVTVTNSAEPLDCKILNATAAPIVFTHTGTPQTKTYTYSTRNLTAAQIVTFSCTHQPTSQTSTVDVRIEVLPKIQEI